MTTPAGNRQLGGCPPRRYYTVTSAGRQALTELAGDNR